MSDAINPEHYRSEAGIQAIDVIEAFGLGFCLGNCVKYVLRAGKKDPNKNIEDLEKARWYLERRIAELRDSRCNDVAARIRKEGT